MVILRWVYSKNKVKDPGLCSLAKSYWNESPLNLGRDFVYYSPFIHGGWVYIDAMNPQVMEWTMLLRLIEVQRYENLYTSLQVQGFGQWLEPIHAHLISPH